MPRNQLGKSNRRQPPSFVLADQQPPPLRGSAAVCSFITHTLAPGTLFAATCHRPGTRSGLDGADDVQMLSSCSTLQHHLRQCDVDGNTGSRSLRSACGTMAVSGQRNREHNLPRLGAPGC
ncbi:hypothetical protein L1887_54106 [Cichorium endivia]|nr:hypothetical protein L1887_54106 [Cichorium endivia]